MRGLTCAGLGGATHHTQQCEAHQAPSKQKALLLLLLLPLPPLPLLPLLLLPLLPLLPLPLPVGA